MSDLFVQHWTDQNQGRNYPLSDTVSRVAISLDMLPNDLIADCYIAVPDDVGAVYISSVTVTSRLVSITLSADESGTKTALGVVTVTKPLYVARHYAIAPFVAGVGGWVSFGSGCDSYENLNLFFDGLASTRLADKAVSVYTKFPVESIKKDGAEILQDLIFLQEGPGIEIIAEDRLIGEETKRCIVIRTAESVGAEELASLAGPCGVRPENGNCASRPVSTINGVAPDATGNVTIEVAGCGIGAGDVTTANNAISITTGITLTTVCVAPRLPDENGCLPGENCTAPPRITRHPVSRIAYSGGTATFTVGATGGGILLYAWRKNNILLDNGGHYSGVTTSTLTITDVDDTDVAEYRCTVSNDYGTATSNIANLTLSAVQPLPISDYLRCEDILAVKTAHLDFQEDFNDADSVELFSVFNPGESWDRYNCTLRYRPLGTFVSPIAYSISTCYNTCESVLLRTQGKVITVSDQNTGLYLVFGYNQNDGLVSYNYAGIDFKRKEFAIYRKPRFGAPIKLLASKGIKGNLDFVRTPPADSFFNPNLDGAPVTYDLCSVVAPSEDPDSVVIALWVRWLPVPTGMAVDQIGFYDDVATSPNYEECWLKTIVAKTDTTFLDGYFGLGASASHINTAVRFSGFNVQYINDIAQTPLPRNAVLGAMPWEECSLAAGPLLFYSACMAEGGMLGSNEQFTNLWENIA